MSNEWVFLLGLRSRTRLMSVPPTWYVPGCVDGEINGIKINQCAFIPSLDPKER